MIHYLDNAATTFPKPQVVYDEVNRCITTYCGNAGRSSHSLSLASAEKIFECRGLLAELFGVSDVERVAFALNTTHAINTVIKGLLKRGDHVIISDLEHNAVLRPIEKLKSEGVIEYDVFPSLIDHPRRSPTLICARIARLIKPNTKMVICTHSSNICSVTLPIKDIGEFCYKRGILFVVDAAQSAGHTSINVDKMNVSALCVPSHKGLYGIQGAGAILLGKGIVPDTLIEGGSGVNSAEPSMPKEPPERFEAGTLPTPAIASLAEGIKTINSIGIPYIEEYEKELYRIARDKLCQIIELSISAASFEGANMLINANGLPSEYIARELDRYGICTRGGYHCAPLAHKTLGTYDGGGVRISFGIFNKPRDIDALATALSRIIKDSKSN